MAKWKQADDWFRESEQRRQGAPQARIRKLRARAAIDAYHRRETTPRRSRRPD